MGGGHGAFVELLPQLGRLCLVPGRLGFVDLLAPRPRPVYAMAVDHRRRLDSVVTTHPKTFATMHEAAA